MSHATRRLKVKVTVSFLNNEILFIDTTIIDFRLSMPQTMGVSVSYLHISDLIYRTLCYS